MTNLRQTGASRLLLLVVAALVGTWSVASFFIADAHFAIRARAVTDQEAGLARQRSVDLSDSITRNLSYLGGIPDLLARSPQVVEVLRRAGPAIAPSPLPLAARTAAWTGDPQLLALSRYLEIAEKSLNADILYVVNAAGDAIAASNWATATSTVGSHFSERDFFRQNRLGQRGLQYAVGKTTRIPGLYFSTPVMLEGKFIGAVVAKIDIPNLSFLLTQIDGFVTDEHGVIILARDRTLEMHSLPAASVALMPVAGRQARYQRQDLPPLRVTSWNDGRLPDLVRLGDRPEPQLLTSRTLHKFGLGVHIVSNLAEIIKLEKDKLWFGLMLAAVGSLLILIGGGIVFYLRSARDAKLQLWKQANFDTLSGLPNRDMFHDRIDHEMKMSERTGLRMALLLIDLDRFKEVNDSLGHDVGDLLLQVAARRIESCVREADTVARLGGDEFAVVLGQIADDCHVEDIAQKIVAALAEPFDLSGDIAHVSSSVGVTLYPSDARDVAGLIKNADQAMYAAKHDGRNRFHYFTQALQDAAQIRLHLANDLRAALAGQQFQLYFQPIVSLAGGSVLKAEALLRWNHPERGVVSPLEFIALAEELRLILPLGAWVRREALRWCARWAKDHAGGFQVSVNLSPIECTEESGASSANDLLDLLGEQGLGGGNLVFEITEGVLLKENPRILRRLEAMRDAGIQVAIDDFGTGYSALSYLKKFDIDYLKIDRSFVCNLEDAPDDMALCEAIIVMAHRLGLKVIAEGVETAGQRDMLAGAGCDYAQGFLFSKPLPPAAFEAWLAAQEQSTS